MQVTTSERGEVLIIAVRGRLDVTTAPELEAQLHDWLQTGHRRLGFELSGLEYISSAGLRVFVQASKELQARGGKLALAGLRDVVRQVFDISGVSFRLTLCPDLEAAVQAVQ